MNNVDIIFSIIFATCDRQDILKKSLEGYKHLQFSKEKFEIIVVDNACLKSTAKMVNEYQKSLPIQYYQEPKKGKNYALNLALTKASGEWYVFTDDDVIPSDDWLANILLGTKKWSEHLVFGGAILPDINKFPDWLDLSNKKVKGAFVIKNLDGVDQDIHPTAIWGPNMVVHSSFFEKGMIFNVDIGPSGKDYIMGSETELLNRLHLQDIKAKYLCNSKVSHQIREEQLTKKWVLGRAYRHGKGIAFNNQEHLKAHQFLNMPRFEVVILMKMVMKFIFSSPFISAKNKMNLLFDIYVQKGKLDFYKKHAHAISKTRN